LIELKVQNTIDISSSFVIFSNNELARFLTLIEQRVDSHMTQKSDMKDRMNLHEFRKFKLDNQRILFKYTFNLKRIDMMII